MVTKEAATKILKPINIWRPVIGHMFISSKTVLQEIINQEYFGLRRIQNFSKLIRDAESHIELFNRLCNRKFLNYGELRQLAREYDLSRNKIQGFIKNRRKPRLYFLIEKGFSKQRSAKKVGAMARARQSRGNAEMPFEIYSRMFELRKNGVSYGRIAEAIFDETGYSYSSVGIRYVLKSAPKKHCAATG